MNQRELFFQLYTAQTEDVVDDVLESYPALLEPQNWRPYGGNESNFGVVENQQASPIPALVEKIINSIDAILTRRCLEEGIDPKSTSAPRSIDEAVERFFPDAKNWDLHDSRRVQAQRIQIIADGPRFKTSLVIYDDGEGQHPDDFADSFLSLLRGNKNEIHFVQGKYNMGGAGAITFCGKKRYQLIASRRYDETGPFGFTLVRRHPLNPEERQTKKNTWYEYLVINGDIPRFQVSDHLNLDLYGRGFRAGTVIKLYSYDLPSGSKSVISRDLNQSINEYLFNPALPLYTIDTPDRYPDDRQLERHLYGLKRRLEEEGNKYVEDCFSEDLTDSTMGEVKVTCYVFKPRIEEKTARATKDAIRREFFKNNMSVLFSVNGQVHGHYTAEFTTRSLKFGLLKDYLLIHVDCTHMVTEFRNELFMASRDRLKDGEESRKLRATLAKLLTRGHLKDVYKRRKESITVEAEDTRQLLRDFADTLPKNEELLRLLGQTLRLEKERPGRRTKRSRDSREEAGDRPRFDPKRYPSFFRIQQSSSSQALPVVKAPLGGNKTIRFSTDVEDHYFDRVGDPGELKIALLDLKRNESAGGTAPGVPGRIDDVLDVVKSSPQEGTIRVTVRPTEAVKVGDTVKLRAELTAPGQSFEEVFFIRISDPQKEQKREAGDQRPDPILGLPELCLVFKEPKAGHATWDDLDGQGIEMHFSVVMHPFVEGELLDKIYVNMDSSVLKNHRSRLNTEEAVNIADQRYISSVYFHTLFLYMITQNRKYRIAREREDHEEVVDLADYLKDLFQSYYAEFLLNFEVQALIDSLEA